MVALNQVELEIWMILAAPLLTGKLVVSTLDLSRPIYISVTKSKFLINASLVT
jgi:hypothetical protein